MIFALKTNVQKMYYFVVPKNVLVILINRHLIILFILLTAGTHLYISTVLIFSQHLSKLYIKYFN